MPLEASQEFQKSMIEKAVQRSLDKASLSKLLMHEDREAVQRIIKVAVLNSKLAHKSNYEAVVSALRASLQDDVPDKYIENAVMEAIRENESRSRHRHLEMSRFYIFVCLLFLRHFPHWILNFKKYELSPPFLPLGLRIYFDDLNSFCDTYFPRTMSLWLLVTGLLMVAAPLTFIYVKKIREARRLQVLRLAIIGDDSVTHRRPSLTGWRAMLTPQLWPTQTSRTLLRKTWRKMKMESKVLNSYG